MLLRSLPSCGKIYDIMNVAQISCERRRKHILGVGVAAAGRGSIEPVGCIATGACTMEKATRSGNNLYDFAVDVI